MSRILQIFSYTKNTLGIGEGKHQSKLFHFHVFNIFLVIFSIFWDFLQEIKHGRVLDIIIKGIYLGGFAALTSFYVYLIVFSSKFENLLKWCENLLKSTKKQKAIHEETVKMFGIIVITLRRTAVCGAILQSMAMYSIKGRIEPTFLTSLLCISQDNVYFRCSMSIILIISGWALTCGITTIMAVIIVCMTHFILVIDEIENLIYMELSFCSKAIKRIVEVHCKIIEYQNILNNLISLPMLGFAIYCYLVLFLIWISIFFAPENSFTAVGGVVTCFAYILICNLNEKLSEAHDRVRIALYDIDWFDLKPFERKPFLLLMILIDQRKLIRAGPFFTISYVELGKMINRAYSCGILINNLVQRHSS